MTAARCLSQDGESQHARASSCVRSRADGDFMALEGRSRALQAPVSINAMRSSLARALALACDDAHVLKRNEVRQTDGCSGPARVGRFRAENSSQADGKRRTRYERDNPGGSRSRGGSDTRHVDLGVNYRRNAMCGSRPHRLKTGAILVGTGRCGSKLDEVGLI